MKFLKINNFRYRKITLRWEFENFTFKFVWVEYLKINFLMYEYEIKNLIFTPFFLNVLFFVTILDLIQFEFSLFITNDYLFNILIWKAKLNYFSDIFISIFWEVLKYHGNSLLQFEISPSYHSNSTILFFIFFHSS